MKSTSGNPQCDEYLKELQYFEVTSQKPHCQVSLPFVLLIVLSLVPGLSILGICFFSDCKGLCCNWLLILFFLLYTVIILIATIIVVRNLRPYWIKVAELNDKQIERLTKLAEDRLEYERLPSKTAINIMERQAKVNMEREIKG